MPGERRRLARHAFHHVAVAAERVDVVVEQGQARPVERAGEPASGDGHADTVAAALPERAGGGLDAGGVAIFRMPRTAAAELAEFADVVEGHGRAAAAGAERWATDAALRVMPASRVLAVDWLRSGSRSGEARPSRG